MNPHVYAPHPLEMYAGMILPPMMHVCSDLAVWNMYYLSTPALDEMRVLTQVEQLGASTAILLVRHSDYKIPGLAEALLQKPSELRGFVTDNGLQFMDVFVGQGWWSIFDSRLRRAEGVVPVDNVINVDFKNRRLA